MKIKSLSLILSVVFFMTTSLFAMQEEEFKDDSRGYRFLSWKEESALCVMSQELISPIVQFKSCQSFWFPSEKEKKAYLKGRSYPFKAGKDLFIFYAPHGSVVKAYRKGLTEYWNGVGEDLTFVSTLFNDVDKGFKEKSNRFYIMELSQVKSITLDISTLEKKWGPYHQIATDNIF